MAHVVSFTQAEARQMRRALNTKYPFLSASNETPGSPVAFMLSDRPERTTRAHYHAVDQFQVIVGGTGKFGRHDVSPYSVHFSRAYTPYGPLLPDAPAGWSFLTLRARFDPGAHFFPEAKDELKQIPGRNPYQISRHVTFSDANTAHEIELTPIADMRDDQGMFACTLRMPPASSARAPSPAQGDGQYVVITRGSFKHDGSAYNALTVIFVEPEDPPFALNAGDQGLDALIMNFPKPSAPREAASVQSGVGRWQCGLCSFAYDEAVGMPNEGIPPGTRWSDVPESWSCPDCSASKSDFGRVRDA